MLINDNIIICDIGKKCELLFLFDDYVNYLVYNDIKDIIM